MSLTIALAQSNFLLGDLAGNRQKILRDAHLAHARGAHLLITPELSLTGYPPEDLLFRAAFLDSVREQMQLLCAELAIFKDLAVIVGHPATQLIHG